MSTHKAERQKENNSCSQEKRDQAPQGQANGETTMDDGNADERHGWTSAAQGNLQAEEEEAGS